MEINNALTTLIDTGADAPSNLYLMSFDTGNQSLSNKLTVRVGNFTIPSIALNTVELPYMNDVYHKPVPSSNINKIGSFSLRVDQYFECYNILREKVAIDVNGDWLPDEDDLEDFIIDNITLNSLKDTDLNTPIKTWSFKDCFILEVGSFTYDYKTSDPISTTIKFTWGNLEVE